MRKLLAVAVLAMLSGCTTGAKPAAAYDPQWCELSEFIMQDGTHIYIYTSPQGNIVVARDKDGHMVATANGKHVDLALEDVIEKITK